MSSEPYENNPNKKRKLVTFDNEHYFDEEDFNIVVDVLKTSRKDICEDTLKTAKDDKDQRICEVFFPYTKTLTASDIEKLSNLKCLRKLILHYNEQMTALPPTISKLQTLEILDLNWARNLTSLPEEIGDCINLKALWLFNTPIRSLPSSIGKLQNLESLDLGCTCKLVNLPEEVGNLSNLKVLELRDSSVIKKPLPEFLTRLTNITRIAIFDGGFSTKKVLLHKDSLLMFAKQCPGLCDVTIGVGLNDFWYLNPVDPKKLSYWFCMIEKDMGTAEFEIFRSLLCKLMHNRYRSRTGFGVGYKDFLRRSPNLWPLLLNSAIYAFDTCYHDVEGCRNRTKPKRLISKPDAIYQLLADGRESFIGVVLDRQKKVAYAMKKGNN